MKFYQLFFNNNPNKKEKSIIRINVLYKNGRMQNGTGFFISKDGFLLTCFHVICGELRNLKKNVEYQGLEGKDDIEKSNNFIKKNIVKIETEFFDGTKKEVVICKINPNFDIALLQTKEKVDNVKFFKLDFKNNVDYCDEIFFCGFQEAVGYEATKYPFAVNTGIISSFPEIEIGGGKYKHVQINSINLGGNSGAPLFKKNSNRVVGIINGNMNI